MPQDACPMPQDACPMPQDACPIPPALPEPPKTGSRIPNAKWLPYPILGTAATISLSRSSQQPPQAYMDWHALTLLWQLKGTFKGHNPVEHRVLRRAVLTVHTEETVAHELVAVIGPALCQGRFHIAFT